MHSLVCSFGVINQNELINYFQLLCCYSCILHRLGKGVRTYVSDASNLQF